MSDPGNSPLAAASPVQPPTPQNRFVFPIVLSTLVPGAGHLLVGKKSKGWVLLVAFLALMACIWPLRLPRFVLVMNFIALGWIVLSLYAGCSLFVEQNAVTERKTKNWWMFAIAALTCIWIKLLLTPFLSVSGFQLLKFGSSAMESTLLPGDQFIADKDFYRRRAVARNDLVVLRKKDLSTVKRVIAIAGDTISGDHRKILLNGRQIDEPFVQHTLSPGANPAQDTFGPYTIPAGKYFVMGDNRDISRDSRTPDFGLLDSGDLMGKPLYIFQERADWKKTGLMGHLATDISRYLRAAHHFQQINQLLQFLVAHMPQNLLSELFERFVNLAQ